MPFPFTVVAAKFNLCLPFDLVNVISQVHVRRAQFWLDFGRVHEPELVYGLGVDCALVDQ